MKNKKTAKERAREYGKQDLGKTQKTEAFLKEFKKDHSKDSQDFPIIVEMPEEDWQVVKSPKRIKIIVDKSENPIDFIIEENLETGVLSLDSTNIFGLRCLNNFIISIAKELAEINGLNWKVLNNQAIQKVNEVVKKKGYILKNDKYPQFIKYSWTLFNVARNEINSILRKERKYPKGIVFSEIVYDGAEIIDEIPDPKQDLQKYIFTKSDKVQAREMLKKMENENYSQILTWKYLDGFSYKEIAKKLKITIKAVERKIAKARIMARGMLTK